MAAIFHPLPGLNAALSSSRLMGCGPVSGASVQLLGGDETSYHDGPAPWDIGQPEPAIVRLASEAS